MQSFFDKRGPRLDTSLPSVRHVQELIRSRAQVIITMIGGQELRGTIHWQDNDVLALAQDAGSPVALLNRQAVIILRSLT